MNFFKAIFCCAILALPGIASAASMSFEACNGRNGKPLSCGVGEGYNEDTGRCETCVDKNSSTNRYISHKVYFNENDKTTLYDPGENTNLCTYRICQFLCLDKGNPSGSPKSCSDRYGRSNGTGWNGSQCGTCDEGIDVVAKIYDAFSDGTNCLYYECDRCQDGYYKSGGPCTKCSGLTPYATVDNKDCVSVCDSTAGIIKKIVNGEDVKQCKFCPVGTYWLKNDDEDAICKPCGKGTFQDKTGQISCIRCPDGSVNDETGSVSCTVCTNGTLANSSHTACVTVCEDGSVANSSNTQCEKCPESKPYSYNGGECFSDLSGMALVGPTEQNPNIETHIELCLASENKFALPSSAEQQYSSCVSANIQSCPNNSYLTAVNRSDFPDQTLWQCVQCPNRYPYSISGANMNIETGQNQCVRVINGKANSGGNLVRCYDGEEEISNHYAALDHSSCLSSCPAGQYAFVGYEMADVVAQCKMCESGKISTGNVTECTACENGTFANSSHTQCISSCPAGQYAEITKNGLYQCRECSDGGVYIEGDENGTNYGCFSSCPEGTEIGSDGYCHLCPADERKRIFWTGGKCVSSDVYDSADRFGKKCISLDSNDRAYLTGDINACIDCPYGYYADNQNLSCSNDENLCGDGNTIITNEETGLRQCSQTICERGTYKTYSGITQGNYSKKYLGCTACDKNGDNINATDNTCVRCGMGLYYDSATGECKKCPYASPYSDGTATSESQCRKFKDYEVNGYTYNYSADGSLTKIACSSDNDMYAPANLIGSCITQSVCTNLEAVAAVKIFDGKRGQCVHPGQTPGYAVFVDKAFRIDEIPDGTFTYFKDSMYDGSVRICVANEDINNYPFFQRGTQDYYLSYGGSGYLNASGDGCTGTDSCPYGQQAVPVQVSYTPKDSTYGQQNITTYQCRKKEDCPDGQKRIYKTITVSKDWFQNFPSSVKICEECHEEYHEGHDVQMCDEESDTNNIRNGSVKILMGFCAPDLDLTGSCTISPDDTYSQLKYAIPNSYEKMKELPIAGNFPPSRACAEQLSLSTKYVNVDTDTVDWAIIDFMRKDRLAIDEYEVKTGNDQSPYFNYGYSLNKSTSNTCKNVFCNYYRGVGGTSTGVQFIRKLFEDSSGCSPLLEDDGLVDRALSEPKALWNYYLDAVAYKLITESVDNSKYATDNWCNSSSFSSFADNYIFYLGFGKDEHKERMETLFKNRLNMYHYDATTNSFQKNSTGNGYNGINLDYSIMEEVYCATSSPLYNEYVCNIVKKSSYVAFEGKINFPCFDGTSTIDPRDASNKNTVCRGLLLDGEHYKNNSNNPNYVQKFKGICQYVCPAGTQQAQDSSSESLSCTPCEPGKFAKNKGSYVCSSCENGYYNPDSGKAECTRCEAGNYVNSKTGATSCTPCQAGYYADKIGLTECKACPQGTYSTVDGATECNKCPTGYTTDDEGATSEKQCNKTLDTLKIKGNDTWKFTFPSFLKLL